MAKKVAKKVTKKLPAFCETLAAMPLTPNGKIDRKGLRERAEKKES